MTVIETEIIQSLKLIGYKGNLLAENDFKKALAEGAKNIEFTKLVSFLTNELRCLCNIDECVNSILNAEDSVSFIMEVSSFLTELGCPHESLTIGHVSDRLNTISDRLLLLQFLIGELFAARILRENNPEKTIDLKLQESTHASDLRKILQTLGFPKPPPNITMQTLMQKLIVSVENTVKKAGNELLGNPIFNGTLSPKQWETLGKVHGDLNEDYRIRREMLLKRFDCTIQSFEWSNKTKGKEELFKNAYLEKRRLLLPEPRVDLSDLLASRDDLAIIEKTSSASVRKNTLSAINKVIIGQVPDRGGRTSEQAPPPPEMPAWQQRNAGPPGGGGFRGRGGPNRARGGSSGRGRGDGSRSFDSVGTYGGHDNAYGGAQHQQHGNNYSQQSSSGSDYSRRNSGGGGGGYSRGGYDSAGTYGSYSQDYQEAKRPRTYDDYQQSRTSYADQYVQESQHNQQFHPRDKNRNHGGSSNYNRGGRNYY